MYVLLKIKKYNSEQKNGEPNHLLWYPCCSTYAALKGKVQSFIDNFIDTFFIKSPLKEGFIIYTKAELELFRVED